MTQSYTSRKRSFYSADPLEVLFFAMLIGFYLVGKTDTAAGNFVRDFVRFFNP